MAQDKIEHINDLLDLDPMKKYGYCINRHMLSVLDQQIKPQYIFPHNIE